MIKNWKGRNAVGTLSEEAGGAAEEAMGAGIVEVAAGPCIEEGLEGVLVDLPELLEAQKILEIFRASVRTRGPTHTPLARGFPHTAAEWSR
jgi:hypothetical protein